MKKSGVCSFSTLGVCAPPRNKLKGDFFLYMPDDASVESFVLLSLKCIFLLQSSSELSKNDEDNVVKLPGFSCSRNITSCFG